MPATLSDAARAFLDQRRFAVLATIHDDGTPQLTVMWYAVDGDEVLMNTATGRVKDGNIRRDSRIAICVEDGYNYVTISGTARLNDDQEIALADIRRLAERYHSTEKADEMVRNGFSKEQRVTIRMTIDHVMERV